LNDIHVTGVAFSPSGQTLAVGGGDGSLVLYETATGRRRHAFAGHAKAVDSVAFSPDGSLLAASSVDAPALLWDVYGTRSRDPLLPKWTANEAPFLWSDLGDTNAEAAFGIMRRLLQNPPAAVALLRQRLRPVEPIGEDRFRKLLAGLDSDEFALRQKAVVELEPLVEVLEHRLREAAMSGRSLEVKRRLESLLAKLDPTAPERRRPARAVEVLEQIGTPEAVQLLETLAAGERGARLTRDAAAALERVRKR
jgi:hypothetical protein